MANVPPERLSPRHVLVALMVAAGKSNRDIGAAVGLSPNRVSTIRQSPLFVELVRQTQRELREQTVGTVVDRLYARLGEQADSTLDALVEFRDQRGDLKVAFGAAAKLFDKLLPTRTEHQDERTVRVSFNARELRQMVTALAEDNGGVAPPRVIPAEAVVEVEVPRRLRRPPAMSLDDAIDEVEATADA